MALAVLADLPREQGSPWVLPAPKDAAKHLSQSVVENAWLRIRDHAGVADIRLHDLRHTMGTYASQAGVNAFQVRDLLRHANVAMTGRYANRDEDPIRSISEIVGERIAAGLAGGAAGEVVPFKRPERDRCAHSAGLALLCLFVFIRQFNCEKTAAVGHVGKPFFICLRP